MSEEEYKTILTDLMNEALEGINADHSMTDVRVDLENKKVLFEFDIVEIPEDDYVGFSGY